ncbi:MAG: prepilin-type N-terminal cleavage/methylation domain-containing protein [Candidatus Aureabacteria bacterium]|nr:prepilin-type N-terminal cleavage/methylation domain-containing protein [Candidatus Auribacterota bacterium]
MKKPGKKESGFTLLEVIVSFGILAVLVLMLANVFNSASTSYNIANRKMDLCQNARIVLDQISREIKGAIIYHNGNRYGFHIRGAGSSGWVSNSVGSEIFFIAPWEVNTTQTSDFVEFGYYLDDGPTANAHDNILKRCAVPDNGTVYDYLTNRNWPSNNTYVDIAYHVRNFTIDWYGSHPSGDSEAWETVEYNPFPPPMAYKGDRIPRAVRIHIEMLHPDDFTKYGPVGKIEQVTLHFQTVVYLNNSIPFN